MLVIGLTGGIGSGKSTVAKLFENLGATVIDADVIARTLTEPGERAFAEILNHFGKALLLPNGTLDRAQLRHIIFHDIDQRRWLENLLHPLIKQSIELQIKKTHAPYCVIVIPLLFEVAPYSFIDRILVVDTPTQLQITRVLARDKIPPSEIEAILNSQIDREYRIAHADDVIHNHGKIEELLPQVEKLHQLYLAFNQA